MKLFNAILLFVCVLLIAQGCNDNPTHTSKNTDDYSYAHNNQKVKDTIINHQPYNYLRMKDSIWNQCDSLNLLNRRKALPTKHYYKFLYNNDSTKYRIEWGIEGETNYISKQEFEIPGTGMPAGYLTSNHKFVVLKQDCGTDCRYRIILSFNNPSVQKIVGTKFSFNLKMNLVAYVPVCYASYPKINGFNDSVFVVVENYLTKKIKLIKETNICSGICKGEMMDCLRFEGDTLVMEWEGSKCDKNNLDLQVKRIPIKI